MYWKTFEPREEDTKKVLKSLDGFFVFPSQGYDVKKAVSDKTENKHFSIECILYCKNFDMDELFKPRLFTHIFSHIQILDDSTFYAVIDIKKIKTETKTITPSFLIAKFIGLTNFAPFFVHNGCIITPSDDIDLEAKQNDDKPYKTLEKFVQLFDNKFNPLLVFLDGFIYKDRTYLFTLDPKHKMYYKEGEVDDIIRNAFKYNGFTLSRNAIISKIEGDLLLKYSEYKQNLKTGVIDKQLLKTFKDKKISISRSAIIFKINEKSWGINDEIRYYMIKKVDKQLNIYSNIHWEINDEDRYYEMRDVDSQLKIYGATDYRNKKIKNSIKAIKNLVDNGFPDKDIINWDKNEVNKKLYLFNVEAKFENELNNCNISKELGDIFKTKGFSISEAKNATVTKEKDDIWAITAGEKIYIVKKEDGKLNIYKKFNLDELTKNVDPLLIEGNTAARFCKLVRFGLKIFIRSKKDIIEKLNDLSIIDKNSVLNLFSAIKEPITDHYIFDSNMSKRSELSQSLISNTLTKSSPLISSFTIIMRIVQPEVFENRLKEELDKHKNILDFDYSVNVVPMIVKEKQRYLFHFSPKCLFSLTPEYKTHVKDCFLSKEIKKAFYDHELSLSDEAEIFKVNDKHWKIEDGTITYRIVDIGTQLNIYRELPITKLVENIKEIKKVLFRLLKKAYHNDGKDKNKYENFMKSHIQDTQRETNDKEDLIYDFLSQHENLQFWVRYIEIVMPFNVSHKNICECFKEIFDKQFKFEQKYAEILRHKPDFPLQKGRGNECIFKLAFATYFDYLIDILDAKDKPLTTLDKSDLFTRIAVKCLLCGEFDRGKKLLEETYYLLEGDEKILRGEKHPKEYSAFKYFVEKREKDLLPFIKSKPPFLCHKMDDCVDYKINNKFFRDILMDKSTHGLNLFEELDGLKKKVYRGEYQSVYIKLYAKVFKRMWKIHEKLNIYKKRDLEDLDKLVASINMLFVDKVKDSITS